MSGTRTSASHESETRPSRWLISALIVLFILFVALAGGVTIGLQSPHWQSEAARFVPWIIGFTTSLILSVIPVAICLVSGMARKRQHERLLSIDIERVKATIYYHVANVALTKINPIRVSNEYSAPMLTFSAVTLFSCLVLLLSSFTLDSFSHPSLILAGGRVVSADTAADANLMEYQRGTFVIAGMAFIGAYVYTLGRLLDRLNNNDLYPISLYYYSARIVIACLVAIVFRHCADALYVEKVQFLVLIAFGIGLAPDLFILAMGRRAFQYIKVLGHKSDPKKETWPTALPLLMLDDLTKDKVDRLNELGIDSAQVLACQNPFVVWPRLPYDLGLVVDWIAAAQLYALVKEKALQKLRAMCVCDIFDLYIRLNEGDACEQISAAIGICPKAAPALVKQLNEDQSFCRLKEVRDALLSHP